MKRFSKILALLLSVCVIAGLIAVFASAEDATDYREVSEDFDELTDAGTDAHLDTWTTDPTGAASADLGKAQVTVGSEESPVNKYVKLYATLGTTMPEITSTYRNGTNFVSYMINKGAAEQRINDHRYVVIQFLFTAEDGKYVDGAYIQPITTKANDLGSVMVSWDGSKYVAKAGTNTTAANSVELNTNGDWNVVTYVLAMDSFADGSATIGENSKTNSYIYVNGKYCAKRWLSSAADFGYFTSLKIGRYYSTSVAAGDNIIVDGVNVRTYLNNLGANGETTYTTAEGVYGVPTFLSDTPTTVAKADAFKMQDVKYSYYSTTVDYPKLSENYVRSGVVAYIGDLGYFTVDAALAALTEGGTIKIFANATLTGVGLKKFYVEAYNGAVPTIEGYEVTSEAIDGGTRYTARVKEYKEIINNLDSKFTMNGYQSNMYRTWTSNETGVLQSGSVGSLVTVNGNSYWRQFATVDLNGNSGGVNGAIGHSIFGNDGSPTATGASEWDINNFGYVATEYLFMAEGGKYIDGMAMDIAGDRQQGGHNRYISRIYIVKDGEKFYASNAASGGTMIALSDVVGEWNVVSVVSQVTDAGVTSYTYVNGQFLASVTITDNYSMTDIIFRGYKNDSATAGDNICVDGFSIRNFNKDYSSTDFYGVDDFFTDIAAGTASPLYCEDIVYNGETTVFPETAGENKYAAGATLGGNSFFFPEGAIMNMAEDDTVEIYKDVVVNTKLNSFNLLVHNGANVTLPEGYKVKTTEQGDAVLYTVEVFVFAYIGERPYDSVADALKDLEEGGTIKVFVDATITGVDLKKFTVEAYNDAVVDFGELVSHNIVQSEADGVKTYELTRRNFLEYTNNTTVTVDTTTTTWSLQSANTACQIKNYKYAVIQYLLKGDDNGNYASGVTIVPTVSVSSSNFGTIQITETSSGVYSVSSKSGISGGTASIPLTNVAGDWNVITMVIKPNFKAGSDLDNSGDFNGDGKYTVGDSASFDVYYYINGTYLGKRSAGSAVDLGHVTQFTVAGATATGSSVTLAGYNARYYLNGLDISSNDYTTPDTYGIDDFIGSYSTADVTALQDVKYSKYSTTSDYPTTTVKGQPHIQTGAVAEVNGIGYFDLDTAWNALAEGGTIKFNAGYTIPATELKNFTILHAEGVDVNIDALAESHKATAIDGGWTFEILPKYNVVYKYGDTEISSENIATEQAPTPSEVVWSAYIKGDASLATWMIKIGDADAVEFTDEWDKDAIAEGVTVIVYPAEDSIVTLTWKGLDGEDDYRVDEYFKGSFVNASTAPNPSPEREDIEGNLWYDMGYDWEATPEVIDKNEEVNQISVPVADVRFKINYTLSARFVANFYIPQEIEGVTIDTIYSNKNLTGTQIPNSSNRAPMPTQLYNLGTKENENLYYKVNEYMSLAPTHLARIQAIQVEYTVVYEGKTYTLVDTSKVSFIAIGEKQDDVVYYAETVLGTGNHDSGTKLVAEFLNLFKCANSSKEGVEEAVDALLATHADCDCKPADLADAVPEASDDTLTFADVDLDIKIDFRTDGDSGGFRVYIDKAWVEANTNVKVSFLPTGVTGKLGIVNNKYVDSETPWHEFDDVSDSGDYKLYGLKNSDDFGLYNYACVITFKIEADGMEEAIKFTYSLGQYLYDVTQNIADAEAPSKLELAYAYKNFVEAAYLYKSGK